MREIEWNNLNQLLVEQGKEIVERYRSFLNAYKKNASNTLYNEFTTFVKQEGNVLTLYGSLPFYWKFLEYGTRTAIGNPPGKFPPINAIMEWVKVKPVTPRPMKNGKIPSIKQLAFLIARAIQRNGTKPYYFLTRSMPEEDTLQPLIAKAVEADMAEWIENYLNENIR